LCEKRTWGRVRRDEGKEREGRAWREEGDPEIIDNKL